MILSIEKKSAAASCKAHDEIFPAEFEGEVKPLKYRCVTEKPVGAYITVPQATGGMFFFLLGGFMIGHATPATLWGGEFGLSGLIIGIFVGVIGREKIRGVFKKWFSRFSKKKNSSLSMQNLRSGDLKRMPLV